MLYPFVKYISGTLTIADLKQEIQYARDVINASRYPKPEEFHIDSVPVFLVSPEDMDELYPDEKKVEPIRFVAERIVKGVLESFLRREDNVDAMDDAKRASLNPINSVLEYVVCEADFSALSKVESEKLKAEDVKELLDRVEAELLNRVEAKLLNRVEAKLSAFEGSPFENIQVDDKVVKDLANQIWPLIEEFIKRWLPFANVGGIQGLGGIIRRALEAGKRVVAQGLYCHKNPNPGRFYKDVPGDYGDAVIFLCPDRICRDRSGRERGIAFAKTMVHEFSHAYMDVDKYGVCDALYHCIEESYANALTLRVFQTYAYETGNYKSGVGKKLTMTVVEGLMKDQPKDYALGVKLFEKATYFPERWRDKKSVVSARSLNDEDPYLDVVYLRTYQNMCIANILDTINTLLG